MASAIGATAFFMRCTHPVDGISCKSYSADASADIGYTTDECGENISAISKGQKTTHSWEGEVLGAAPADICLEEVGLAMAAPPTYLWEHNVASTNGILICTGANYTESAGEYAKFSLTAEKSPALV